MKSPAAALLLAALLAPAVRGQTPAGDRATGRFIDSSLMEALVAMDRPELAGIFAFVPDADARVAMADFLLRDPAALKRFIKKAERDLREAKAVNVWDKEVLLHIVAATAEGGIPGVPQPKKETLSRVSALSLAVGVPRDVLAEQRARQGGL